MSNFHPSQVMWASHITHWAVAGIHSSFPVAVCYVLPWHLCAGMWFLLQLQDLQVWFLCVPAADQAYWAQTQAPEGSGIRVPLVQNPVLKRVLTFLYGKSNTSTKWPQRDVEWPRKDRKQRLHRVTKFYKKTKSPQTTRKDHKQMKKLLKRDAKNPQRDAKRFKTATKWHKTATKRHKTTTNMHSSHKETQ